MRKTRQFLEEEDAQEHEEDKGELGEVGKHGGSTGEAGGSAPFSGEARPLATPNGFGGMRGSTWEARGKLGGSWGKHTVFGGSTPFGHSNSLKKRGKQLPRVTFL